MRCSEETLSVRCQGCRTVTAAADRRIGWHHSNVSIPPALSSARLGSPNQPPGTDCYRGKRQVSALTHDSQQPTRYRDSSRRATAVATMWLASSWFGRCVDNRRVVPQFPSPAAGAPAGQRRSAGQRRPTPAVRPAKLDNLPAKIQPAVGRSLRNDPRPEATRWWRRAITPWLRLRPTLAPRRCLVNASPGRSGA